MRLYSFPFHHLLVFALALILRGLFWLPLLFGFFQGYVLAAFLFRQVPFPFVCALSFRLLSCLIPSFCGFAGPLSVNLGCVESSCLVFLPSFSLRLVSVLPVLPFVFGNIALTPLVLVVIFSSELVLVMVTPLLSFLVC